MEEADTIDLVVADDHPIVRKGITSVVQKRDDINIVGVAEDGYEALEKVRQTEPDVLLLDMEMSQISGPEVARRLEDEDVRLLAFSSYENSEYVRQLLNSGAFGYLTKQNAPDLIVDSVRAVAEGERRWFVKPVDEEEDTGLTKREEEVLALIAKGMSNEKVAEKLGVQTNTIRKHASSIYNTLGVNTAREAIALAWQDGIVPKEEPD